MAETTFHRLRGIQEILVISLSCIGDVLLTTPVLRVLKDHFPDARITMLAGKTSHEIVRAHPLVDTALIFDNKGAHRDNAGKARLIRELRATKYDLVVDLRNSAIPYFLRTRFRITAHRAHLKNRNVTGRHAIDRHLDVLALHGFPITTRTMLLEIPEDTAAHVKQLMEDAGLFGHGPVIGVYPGAGSPYKLYPSDKFAHALQEIAKLSPDARFVAVGGPDDAGPAAAVTAPLGGRAADFSGKLNILETAAAVSNCDLFISNDSGPMHIAAALEVPTVALFGPTDAHRYGPRGSAHRIVWHREPCNPCKFPECGRDTCIDGIPESDIVRAAAELLNISADEHAAPAPQPADLAVIIVSYKTRDLLEKCLASIFNDPCDLSLQVIVADNNSGDGAPDMVREKFPDVLLFDNKENLGYSAANNQGIRAANARHYLLLNPDTEVNAAALAAMAGFLDRHPAVGAAGCQLLNTDGTHQESFFHFPVPLSRYFEHEAFYPAVAHRLLRLPPAAPRIDEPGAQRVDIIKGACLMINGRAMDEVGLLDEDSFLYADDIDWCLRARRMGWDAYLLTHHSITHHGYASTDQETYITIVSSRRSALLLYRKHYPRVIYAIWALFIFLEIIYKYLLNGLRIRTGRNDRKTKDKFRAYKVLLREITRGSGRDNGSPATGCD